MTIMYTIGCILMATALALSIMHIFYMCDHWARTHKIKIKILPILVVIGGFLIIFSTSTPRLDKYYGIEKTHSYQELFPEAYEEGYKEAIEDAILVKVAEDSYIISFDGQDNVYVCDIIDVNNNN